MWVVYCLAAVLLAALAGVGFLLFMPLRGRLAYDGELTAKVWLWGYPVTLWPLPETEDKPEKKPTKKKTAKKPIKKKASTEKTSSQLRELKELLLQDDLWGTVAFLQRMAKLAVQAANRARKAVTVDRLSLELLVAADDAADTAVRYGQVCSAVYPAVAALEQAVRVRKRHLRVEPNFLLEQSGVRFEVRVHVTVFRLIGVGVPFAFGLLKEFLTEYIFRKDTAMKEVV